MNHSGSESSSLDSERELELVNAVEGFTVKKGKSGKKVFVRMGDGTCERVTDSEDTIVYRKWTHPHTSEFEKGLIRSSLSAYTKFLLEYDVHIESGWTCWNRLGGTTKLGIKASRGVLCRLRQDVETNGVILPGENSDGSKAVHLQPMRHERGIVSNLITLKKYVVYRVAGLLTSATVGVFDDGTESTSDEMRVADTWPETGWYCREQDDKDGPEDVMVDFPPNVVLLGKEKADGLRIFQSYLPLTDLQMCSTCESKNVIDECLDRSCTLCTLEQTIVTCFRIIRRRLAVPTIEYSPHYATGYMRVRRVLRTFSNRWRAEGDYIAIVAEMSSLSKGHVIKILSSCDSLSASWAPENMGYLRKQLNGAIKQVPVMGRYVVGSILAWNGECYIHRHSGEQLVSITAANGIKQVRLRQGSEHSDTISDDDLVGG